MMRSRRIFGVWLVVALFVCADCAQARQAGGGGRAGGGKSTGGGGGKNAGGGGAGRARTPGDNNDNNNDEMRWYGSLAAAVEAAKEDGIPVMAVLRRVGNLDDQKTVERLASWPQAAQLSKEGLAAVRLNAEGSKAEELSAKLKLPSIPGIMWLDHYGNPILGQAMPGGAPALASVTANWKSTLGNIDRFFKDHNGRGERCLEKGKLREAYLEFACVAPFKGPEPERAKSGQQKTRERWGQLLQVAGNFPADSHSRGAIIRGLRRDVLGTDYAAGLEEALQKVGAPAPIAAADKPAASVPDAVAAAGAPAKSASVMPAVEDKPLAEVISARVAAPEQPSEDAGVDPKFLLAKGDGRLKDAEKLVQDGLGEYRKATADSADRGEARNGLLRAAHTKFEKALVLLEESVGGKPDTQTEKLMERIGMLMYGCLKYQSL